MPGAAPEPLRTHEVVVLGAGPAGAAAAALLARRSHDVAIVRPRTTPAGSLAESVPPSARSLLHELGLVEAVTQAQFHPNGGNTVWWAGTPERSEVFPPGDHGFQVDRRGLETALTDAVEAMGAHRYEGASARAVERGEGGGWQVECVREDGTPLRIGARWVIDATGRHGLLARRLGREPDRATTTLALVGRWRRQGGWPATDPTHTLVESYADGWGWSVPLGPDVRCFTAMVDQRQTELEGGDVRAMLSLELAKAPHLAALIRDAEPDGPGWGCPASLYTSSRFAEAGVVLAGDAGSCIDPLSSYGVKKALSSGWLAGVVAHTALIEPKMTDTAVDFFRARESEVYRSFRRHSTDFLDKAAQHYRHEYWVARAEAARAAGASAPDDPEGAEDIPEPRLREAYERIRIRERLGARRGRTLHRLERAAIEHQRVVLDSHVASALHPGGLRHYRDVDLRVLVSAAPGQDDVADLWEAYNRLATPVNLPDFLAALAAAFAAGLLEHGDA